MTLRDNILKIGVLFLFILLIQVPKADAQNWIGGISSDWHDANNWNPALVPGAGSSVEIRTNDSSYKPIITQNVTIKSLVLPPYNAGELTVTGGAVLTISDSFTLNQSSTLNLNNGTLLYTGSTFDPAWSSTVIDISNNGVLHFTNSLFYLRDRLNVDNGTVLLDKGLSLHTNGILNVVVGDITVFGQAEIQGKVYGGLGHFVFTGDQVTNSGEVTIGSSGRFYMDPYSADGDLDCDPSTHNPPPLSGGKIDFFNKLTVAGNGRFYGGDAEVTIHDGFKTGSSAYVQMYNGTLIFKGDVDITDNAVLKIDCKGSIDIFGNTHVKSSGYIYAGEGDLTIRGNTLIESSGYFNGESANVNFGGDVTIRDNNGVFNAGSSTVNFNGGTFYNHGNFNADTSTFIFGGSDTQTITGSKSTITFYNLIVENGADVTSTQNVIVEKDMSVGGGSNFTIELGKTLNVVEVVTGHNKIFTNKPYVIVVEIVADNLITVVFNSELDPVSSQTASNYVIHSANGGVIDYPTNPVLGGAGMNEVTLSLGFNIVDGERYYLIVNSVKNIAGLSISNNHRKLIYLFDPVDLWRWTGLIDSDWEISGNWQKNMLPASTSNVYIPVTSNDPVIGTKGHVIKSLKIDSGASLTIGDNANITINEIVQNNAGEAGLKVISNNLGTGSLICYGDIVGSFQRYISGEPENWQMLSSPVKDQSISGEFTPTGGQDPFADGTRYDFYAWHEPDTSWVSLLNDDQPPTWNSANGSNSFVSGRGYMVLYKDLHPTLTFSGIFTSGNVSVPVSKSTGNAMEFGSNLLGNPYPSSIDWKADPGWNRSALTENNGGYDLWIWSEENLNYGAYNSGSVDDYGTLGVSRYIAPTQGFFVKAAQSGVVTMSNQLRVHKGSENWLKSMSSDEESRRIKVTVRSEERRGGDEIIMEFDQNRESGTLKKFSLEEDAPTLFIPDKGSSYSIKRIEKESNVKVFPVSFKAGRLGSYILDFDFDPFDFDFLELHDNLYPDRIIDLTKQNSYRFEAGFKDPTGRFVIQTAPGVYADPHSTLPVEIFSNNGKLYIDARLLGGKYSYEIYSLTGQILRKDFVEGGALESVGVNVPVGAVIVVLVYGKEGRSYKKVQF